MFDSQPGLFIIIRRPGGESLAKRRCWYEGDGENKPNEAASDKETKDDGKGSGSGTGTSAGQSGGQNQPETFTFTASQLAERLNREVVKTLNNTYSELGVKNLDELKTVVSEFAKLKDGDKTESKKLSDKIADLEKKQKEAEDRAQKAESASRLEKRNTKLLTAFKDAEHPADVIVWLEANAKTDLDAVQGEDGTVDDKKVQALVDRVRKERPTFFKKQGPGSLSNRDGSPASLDEKKKEEARRQHFARARRNV